MTGAAPPDRTMPGDDAVRDLMRRGVEAGIITEDQAVRLAALASDEAAREAVQDDERLRFVTGFADVFVTIGLLLFLGSASYLGAVFLGTAAGNALAAVLAWGLAEFFARRRRMALPSIVLLVIFAASVFAAVTATFGVNWRPILPPFVGRPPAADDLIGTAVAAIATLILVTLHYRRFGVPITVAAGMAALIGALLALILAMVPSLRLHLDLLLIPAGLASFALAMRFDLSDPGRLTRASDIAFWLHLLAAPLIVHPVLSALVSGQGRAVTGDTATAVLCVVLLLSLVALITDRRAILVSGLVYAGTALWSLIREIGAATWTFPLTILLLGGFVLLLSAGWHPLRRALLTQLPDRLARMLPRPVAS